MKASELRIGNWYEYISKNKRVGRAFLQIDNGKDIDRADSFDEIPLTSDWLQRFGFRTFDGTIWGMQIKTYHIQIFFYDCWNLTIESDNEKCELQGYWAVHNFQNIIFEITNEYLIAR